MASIVIAAISASVSFFALREADEASSVSECLTQLVASQSLAISAIETSRSAYIENNRELMLDLVNLVSSQTFTLDRASESQVKAAAKETLDTFAASILHLNAAVATLEPYVEDGKLAAIQKTTTLDQTLGEAMNSATGRDIDAMRSQLVDAHTEIIAIYNELVAERLGILTESQQCKID